MLFRRLPKKVSWSAISAVAGFAFLLVAPMPAFASALTSFFAEVIFAGIMSPLAYLMNWMVVILLDVSQYNGFGNAPIVEKGWVILRNLSNMFFVLILLIIAISSIVKWQAVNYRQNLRRLLMMAVLINFSKTIVVFFIDLSQVITLTFISAVAEVLQAGVITALGLDKLVNPVTSGGVIDFAGDFFTFLVGGIMFAVATLVIGAILIIFLARIIALWMVIVFAPLAFISSTLPQTKEWYDRWWKILGQNLTVAPVLAFMLWLVFAVIADTGSSIVLNHEGSGIGTVSGTTETVVGGIASSTMVGFMVGIGLLMYSIKLAVQMGAAGAGVAQKFANKVQGTVKQAGVAVKNRTMYGRSGYGGVVGRAANVASDAGAKIAKRIGLATVSENIRTRQGDRMEKREKAEEQLVKRLTNSELEARANRVTTSAPELAVIRKQQIARGKIGDRRLEEMPAEEMQRIRQQIEYKEHGAFTTLGVRGDTDFTRDKMDLRSQLERTPDEQEDKARSIEREVHKRSPKFSEGDLRDGTVMRAFLSEHRAGRKSSDDIAKVLQNAEQETVDMWTTMLQEDLNAMIPNKTSPADTRPAANGPEGERIRTLLSRIDPSNALRYAQSSTPPAPGTPVPPGTNSFLPELPAPPRTAAQQQAIVNAMDYRLASTIARSMKSDDVSRLSDDDLRLYALHASASNFNTLARNQNITSEQMRIMMQSVKDMQRNLVSVTDRNLRNNIQSLHDAFTRPNSQFRTDYQTLP